VPQGPDRDIGFEGILQHSAVGIGPKLKNDGRVVATHQARIVINLDCRNLTVQLADQLDVSVRWTMSTTRIAVRPS